MIPQSEEKKLIDNKAFMSAVKDALNNGLDASFTVTGMSMWPFFTGRRDSVTVKKCTFYQIRKGDIVLFSPTDDVYLLHRVIKKTDENFVTAGDGNTFADGVFTPDKIIAVVREIHRKNKAFSADKITFRFLSFMWLLLFPVRKPFLAILKKAKKL